MLGPPFVLTRRGGRDARGADGGRDPLGSRERSRRTRALPRRRGCYDHGPQHPLRPQRVLLTWDLIRALGLDALAERRTSDARAPPRTTPRSSSSTRPTFVDATRRAGDGEDGDWRRFGYGPGDNPIFDRMHEAGALVAGAQRRGGPGRVVGRRGPRVQRRRRAASRHAGARVGVLRLRRPGGGHRVVAARGRRAGRLRRRRRASRRRRAVHLLRRPARADDLDPRVRAVVLPRAPATSRERGGRGAEGSAVNVPLPPFTGDDAWLDAFRVGRAAAGPAVRARRAGHPARAATRTRPIRSRSCSSPPGRTARPRRSCTRWRTRRPAAAGSPPAAAGTSGRAWSRARGRSRSPRWRVPSSPTSSPRAGSRRRSARSAARSRRRSPSRARPGGRRRRGA